MINCPGTCSSRYAVGTAVQLTATPDSHSVFSGWTGAPIGHEMDNPLAITVGTDNLNITATFTALLAAWVSSSGGTTAFTGTTYFAPTTSCLRNNTIGVVEVKLSAPIVLRSLWVRLAAALPGGVGASNVVFKYVVNGTPSSAMVVTLTSDGGVTANPLGSANGTLALSEGDRLAVQAVFTSGSGTCQVLSLSGGYTP